MKAIAWDLAFLAAFFRKTQNISKTGNPIKKSDTNKRDRKFN